MMICVSVSLVEFPKALQWPIKTATTVETSSQPQAPIATIMSLGVSYGQVNDEVTAFGVTYASAFLSWYCRASAMAIETSVCRPAFMRTTLHIIGSAFLLAAFVMSSNNCEISVTLNTDYLTILGMDVAGSSQKPLRHSRHSGVPVSNGQA